MFGLFWRQFSIAVCDGAVWPSPLPTQAIWLLPLLIPKPFRKPLCRRAPTDDPACSSSIPIVTVLPFVAARAYLPIRTPALKLFVAKRAFVTVFGVVGESSAITSTPAFRAFLIALFSAFASATVIRIPFTPAVVMFSIAAIWLALSELDLPAAVFSEACFF